MAANTQASAVDATSLTMAQRFQQFNKILVFIMIYMGMCAFNFGYDVGTFGGVQAMNSFGRKFGEYNEAQQRYSLPGWLSSIMTATPFLGKAAGCILCGWIAERWGRRAAILALCIVSFVGVILQAAAQNAAMFTTGRVILFAMTGMAIVVVPIYQAETAPKALRGMFGSTIQLMIIFGQVVANLVTYGTKGIDSDAGWLIPVTLQVFMPILIFLLLPFVPESPRWLLSRDRREDAIKNLRKLRKAASEEDLLLEIDALVYAQNNEVKGSWAEVFDKTNRVRTAVAVLAMFGQQITGQAFPSQYGIIFYQSQGFGDRAFLFGVIQNVASLVAVVITWFYIDTVGRRPALLGGGSMMAVFLFILAGMGSVDQSSFNRHEQGAMVASLMLFGVFFSLSWAPVSYVIVSETAALRVKEKTNLLACVISVLTTFVTSFTIPYLINDAYAGLGGKVGYIYGAINVAMVVATFFFIPELKGRTLEEVDQLFSSGIALRNFNSIKTKTAEELYIDQVLPKGGTGEKRIEAAETRV